MSNIIWCDWPLSYSQFIYSSCLSYQQTELACHCSKPDEIEILLTVGICHALGLLFIAWEAPTVILLAIAHYKLEFSILLAVVFKLMAVCIAYMCIEVECVALEF